VRNDQQRWGALALIAATLAVMLRTRLSPLWMIAVGAIAGVLGTV
jgi:chromate transporter